MGPINQFLVKSKTTFPSNVNINFKVQSKLTGILRLQQVHPDEISVLWKFFVLSPRLSSISLSFLRSPNCTTTTKLVPRTHTLPYTVEVSLLPPEVYCRPFLYPRTLLDLGRFLNLLEPSLKQGSWRSSLTSERLCTYRTLVDSLRSIFFCRVGTTRV